MAEQVGELEGVSKLQEDKNSITLFNDNKDNCYSWEQFINSVLGEKFKLVQEFLIILKIGVRIFFITS